MEVLGASVEVDVDVEGDVEVLGTSVEVDVDVDVDVDVEVLGASVDVEVDVDVEVGHTRLDHPSEMLSLNLHAFASELDP